MNCDGKSFLNAIGSLLTHAWGNDYEFTKKELNQINEVIDVLLKLVNQK